MRIFLDANILFSAAKSDGAIRRFLKELSGQGHVFAIDAYVAEEARRNIAAKAPGALVVLDDLMSRMACADAHAGELDADTAALLPEKDRPVLAAAIRQACEVLLNGDSTHFGALYGRTVQGVTIHSPRSLALALSDPPRPE